MTTEEIEKIRDERMFTVGYAKQELVMVYEDIVTEEDEKWYFNQHSGSYDIKSLFGSVGYVKDEYSDLHVSFKGSIYTSKVRFDNGKEVDIYSFLLKPVYEYSYLEGLTNDEKEELFLTWKQKIMDIDKLFMRKLTTTDLKKY